MSNFFIKEEFIFENFDSKNLTIVDVISPDLKNAKIFVTTNSVSEDKLLIEKLNNKSAYSKKNSFKFNFKIYSKNKILFDNSLNIHIK